MRETATSAIVKTANLRKSRPVLPRVRESIVPLPREILRALKDNRSRDIRVALPAAVAL